MTRSGMAVGLAALVLAGSALAQPAQRPAASAAVRGELAREARVAAFGALRVETVGQSLRVTLDDGSGGGDAFLFEAGGSARSTARASPGEPIIGTIVKGGRNPGGGQMFAAPGNPVSGVIIKGGKNPGGAQFANLPTRGGRILLPREAAAGAYTLVLQIPAASLPERLRGAAPTGIEITFEFERGEGGWVQAKGSGSPKQAHPNWSQPSGPKKK